MVTSWALWSYESLMVATDSSQVVFTIRQYKNDWHSKKGKNLHSSSLSHYNACCVFYTGLLTLSFKKSIAISTEHKMWMNMTNEARGMRKIFGLWKDKALGNGTSCQC
jgi:hypothetical protein